MAVTAQQDEIRALVEQQVDEILLQRFGAPFTSEQADAIERHEAQIQSMLADDSLGRILNGPLWLSGASVVDGTVTAGKLSVNTLEAVTASTGTLNVTGTMTAAASYPALSGERITITSSELAGYNASDAKTFQLAVDGSGFIGIGGSQLSWTTGGAVTVPAAAISSLTIADVGSGTFNSNFDAGTGRVRAGTALERVELTSAGLKAYDTGGTETFALSASTGSLSHTGTYTIRNASSGARIEITNIGIKAYNSGGAQTFELLTTNGSGFIGSSPQISFGAGSLSIPGGSLTAGSVTANKLSVSTLSAITADLGTITAGSITAGSITADTINSGTLNGALLGSNSVSSGAVSSLDVGKLSTGTVSSTTITLGSGGSIQWESGNSYIESGIMQLNANASGGAGLRMRSGATGAYGILGTVISGGEAFPQLVAYNSSGGVASRLVLGSDGAGSARIEVTTSLVPILRYDPSTGILELSSRGGDIELQRAGTKKLYIDSSDRVLLAGDLHPGDQLNQYIGYRSTPDRLRLAGPVDFVNHTTGGSVGNWSSSSLNGDAYIKQYIGGTLRRIPFYADA